MTFPDWLTKARSIAVVGYGREGKSTTRFLQKYFPDTKLLIYETFQQEFVLPPVDVIFKSPGIPRSSVRHEESSLLTSQADLFVQLFGAKTIAVTGTKGKSSTAHAIAHVLNALGHRSLLVGNIGHPALDFVSAMEEAEFAVFEMSAFQAESLTTSVAIAVFTSLYQDHLDYYDSMDAYVDAKANLFRLQDATGLCLYRDEYPQIVALLEHSRATKIPYRANMVEYPTNDIPAVLIAARLGASEKQIKSAMATLTPLPGRLECVAVSKGISFFDDALATIPEATILAIKSVPNVQTLIAGGHDRHQDFAKLAAVIADSDIKTLLLFPVTGQRLGQAVRALKPELAIFSVESMEEAVKLAYAHTDTGRSVLLSSASPSYGIFTDYNDRSRQYKEWIKSL